MRTFARCSRRSALSSVDGLFEQIPPPLRLPEELDLPTGVAEQEILADVRQLAARNRSADDLVCFAGAGAYDHYIPSVVWALAGRSEFSTSYTPYQPELSQGVLQTLFEFQSMICSLTAMDVSNASLYDGATALRRRRTCAAASSALTMWWRAVSTRDSSTRCARTGRVRATRSMWRTRRTGVGGIPASVSQDVAAVVVQHPNVFGAMEDVRAWAGVAHAAGARLIQIFDPTSLGVLAPPGDLGADIAVAEGQPLGNHLAFGGPYLGILAARMADVRRMPGRIVGETVDAKGRTGYVLTLQAREQHIRREKATSNICTNQTLMALAATIYLAWLGPEGFAELGEQCAAKAAYAYERLCAVPGVEPAYPGAAVFKEFALRLSRPAAEVCSRLVDQGFLAGVPAAWVGPEVLLVAVTEQRTRSQIDAFADALAAVLA